MNIVLSFIYRLLFLSPIWYFQRRYHFFQYLYFLRMPILLMLLLLLLPWASLTYFPILSRNWYELDGPLSLFIVTWLTLYLSWILMYTAGLIFFHAAEQNKLAFSKTAHEKQKLTGQFANRLPKWSRATVYGFPLRLFIFALPAIPLIRTSYLHTAPDVPSSDKWLAIASAAGAALLGWLLVTSGQLLLRMLWKRKPLRRPRAVISYWIYERLQVGTLVTRTHTLKIQTYQRTSTTQRLLRSPADTIFHKAQAWAFFLLTFVLYAAGSIVLHPNHRDTTAVPALAYLLILSMLVGWILPYLTMKLDKYRVPVIEFFLISALLVSPLPRSDYRYQIEAFPCPLSPGHSPRFTPRMAYQNWANRNPRETYPTMIVVAASGGGITAARWSTVVLTELQKTYPELFARSIFLISATSGGSVGSMYFVDRYSPEGFPRGEQDLHAIVDAASQSTLEAIGWGLAYPDFWRLLSFGLPVPFVQGIWDRAWAQERQWQGSFADPHHTSLQQWGQGIREGWRPTLVFNATVGETGEQLLISPLSIASTGETPDGPDASIEDHAYRSRDFFELYPGTDLAIATAARLSASFPLVTPMASPALPSTCNSKAFHVADGGYYDNFGIMAAIEVLEQILQAGFDRRVLLIEIRASPSYLASSPREGTTLGDELAGPFKTMLKVRWSSQLTRNDQDVRLLRERWQGSVDILPVVFELKESSPLSWHLSPREKQAITAHFKVQEDSACQVRQFLAGKHSEEIIGRGLSACRGPKRMSRSS